MKILTYAILAGLALIVGCTSPSVKVDQIEIAKRPPNTGVVDVYEHENQVEKEYSEYASLRFEGMNGLQKTAARNFTAQAGKIGADAIIMSQPERKVNFSGGVQSESAIYSATAIIYEK
jgi:hypothetical protein